MLIQTPCGAALNWEVRRGRRRRRCFAGAKLKAGGKSRAVACHQPSQILVARSSHTDAPPYCDRILPCLTLHQVPLLFSRPFKNPNTQNTFYTTCLNRKDQASWSTWATRRSLPTSFRDLKPPFQTHCGLCFHQLARSPSSQRRSSAAKVQPQGQRRHPR